jgi:histidine triad (HIT) family protein
MDKEDCIFCKIVQGEIPSSIIFEDDTALAFLDINPAAPTHILIIPKEHIGSVNDLDNEHENMVGHLITIGKLLADDQGISASGYRLIINTGQDSGQVVHHLHLHLLGGRRMGPLG